MIIHIPQTPGDTAAWIARAGDHLTRQQLLDLGADAGDLPPTAWTALDGSPCYPAEVVSRILEGQSP